MKLIFTDIKTKFVYVDVFGDGVYRSKHSKATYTLEEAKKNKNFTMQNEKGEYLTR